MKKVLICGVAALVLLLAGGTALTSERGKAKRTEGADRIAKRTGAGKISEEEKQWKAKLEAMTPEQKRNALAQRALENDLAPWKQVRQIAAEEKAVKTLAAIDKIIVEKQEQFKKKMIAAEKRGQPEAEKSKGEGNRPAGEKQPRKRKGESQN